MKKRYLIMLIIAIVLVIALGAGFAFAYFFTDIFRSNKQLFSKYISQNKEIVDILKDEDVKAYSEKQKNTAYTSEGTIKTNVTFPDSSEAQIANALQNCNITFVGKTDNLNKYMHQSIKANYSDTQSMQFDLYRNGDVYAGKINEVLFKYVGIENNNLKEFATKMQLPENVLSAIPNKIDLTSLTGATNSILTDEEKSSLKEKYLKIITDSLTDDMFSKENSSEDTIYTLTVDSAQATNIILKILQNLKEDELIIAKLKNYAINNFNLTEQNVEPYVTQYKNTLQNAIDGINSAVEQKNTSVDSTNSELDPTQSIETPTVTNSQTTTENANSVIEPTQEIIAPTNPQTSTENTNSEKYLTIKVHANKGNLQKTEIILNDIGNFVITKSDDGVKFETINNGKTETSAFIQKLKLPNETKFEFAFSKQNTQIFDLMVGFSGLDTDTVHENSELTFDFDLGNSTITNAKTKFVSTYKNTKTFGAIQKDEIQNSEILLINTAPSMQNLETLYNNVATKTVQLNNAKLQALGLTEEQNPFMYYIPSVVPIGATYGILNPSQIPYYLPPIGVAVISSGIMVVNNARNTINSDLSQIELENFNTQFTAYSGSNKTSSEVRALYSMIIANNSMEKSNNTNRFVKVNNQIPTSVPNNIDESKIYTIDVEYNENGYVDNIKIN